MAESPRRSDPLCSRAETRPADVLLHHDGSAFARLICLLDGSEVHHASLVLSGERVAESLFRTGVVERDFEESLKPRRWVLVRRYEAPAAGSLSPVLECARRLVGEGHRYGYEQLLLLAILCVTRPAPRRPGFRAMLLGILKTATLEVARVVERFGPEARPLVCSGFVHTCFGEAEPCGVYALRIEREDGVRSPGDEVTVLEQTRRRLLDDDDGLRDAAPRPPHVGGAAASEEELEQLIQNYLDGIPAAPDAGLADPVRDPDDGEVAEALLRLAEVAVGEAGEAEAPGFRERAPRAPGKAALLDGLEEIGKRLVTPGDLFRTASLTTLGRLHV